MNRLIQVWEIHPLGFLLLSGLFAILFSIGYISLAEDAVEIMIEQRRWAFCGQVADLNEGSIDFLRAIWPFAIVCQLAVYALIGILNRIR